MTGHDPDGLEVAEILREASALIGSLGGIGAIAREVFGDSGDAAAATTRRVTPPRSTPTVNPFGNTSES